MPQIGWKWKKKLKFWHQKILKNEEISWKEELSHPWIFLYRNNMQQRFESSGERHYTNAGYYYYYWFWKNIAKHSR